MGGMASRKNLKKWIYLSGKTRRLIWIENDLPLVSLFSSVAPP
jgi:hypothetical protein